MHQQPKDIVLKYKKETNIIVAISSIWYVLQSLDLSHKKQFLQKNESQLGLRIYEQSS